MPCNDFLPIKKGQFPAVEPPQTITRIQIGCYFLTLSFFTVSGPAFFVVSIVFCVVSTVVFGESAFSCASPLFLLTHDEQDEMENITVAASTPIFNEVFII